MTVRSPYLRGPGARPHVVGHRGAAALAPENTLAAFRLAARLGVDAVEFDVQRTRDGVPIVIHDDTLDRTTNGHGRVCDTSYAEIRSLNAGSKGSAPVTGEHVPALDDVLDWALTAPTGLVLELKQPSPGRARPRDDGLVRCVLDALRARDLLARTLIISFDHPSIAETLRQEPRARAAPITEGPVLVDPLAAIRALPGILGIHERWWWISRTLVEAAHGDGLHVHAWGFGHPIDAAVVQRLIALGVDSFSADAPDRMLELVGPSG